MTISRRKKKLMRIINKLNRLKEDELSKNKGKYIYDPSTRRLNKKEKRHSGRISPFIPSPTLKYDEIKQNALEPEIFYDDWEDWRDSSRDLKCQREIEKIKKKRKKTLLNIRNLKKKGIKRLKKD